MRRINTNDTADRLSDAYKRATGNLGEVVDTRWYVSEYTPECPPFGYYDIGTSSKEVKVSGYMDSKQECEDWMAGYEPDEGNSFFIRKEELRERTIREWRRAPNA